MATAGLAWRQTLREELEMLEIALESNWMVGRATRLNLLRTLDLDRLTGAAQMSALWWCTVVYLFLSAPST